MVGIVLCSRISSSRVNAKTLIKYNGKTHIELLIQRLSKSGIHIYLAVPESDVIHYSFLLDIFKNGLTIYSGVEDDPMLRMYNCAVKYGLTTVIRVTHDKIFVDVDRIQDMLSEFKINKIDYLYSSDFIPGTGYEILTTELLKEATKLFSRVEHISYAAKAIAKHPLNYRFDGRYEIRLLVDYKEDVQLMNVLFATLGTDCTLKQVIALIDKNYFLRQINKLPQVTVYTCAKNAEKWIQEAMGSVAVQGGFKDYEYLLIDDYSNDKTTFYMSKFCQLFKNARFIRNDKNIGLASSSNIALKNARGKYIIRLDADDFFVGKNIIGSMISELESNSYDVIYPNCYAGLSKKTIQKGSEKHHVGGALFKTSAINHIKFTDNLRNHDSLDIFLRSKEQLKFGYYNRAAFCYRQHNESMSKNNLADREKTRKIIESKYYYATKI